ncbi:MAG: chemotaxis protein CheR, partial [Gemmatimonadetes bacterium]|nr:chemotaxis protein CheR [Gemmatimonadota bacterium]
MDDRRFARVRRRLEGYLSLSGERNPEQHLDSIAGDPEARRALRGFATTGASEFFRDPGQFQTLAAEILPALTEATGRFEAWSAGCSCGAEPYSLAMALEDLRSRPDYRVLGTDIDEASVARARAGGPYAPHELTNVDQERLLRYFLEEKGAYRVRPELRRRIALRVHDLLRDEFEIGFDLILCRNVAVYLSSTAKNGLIERLAAALRPGGVLFLGASETVPFPAEKGLEHIHGPFYRRPAG